jgi:hypothetical protein
MGVTAGKFSPFGRYFLAIPAYWAMSMVVGFFLIRTFVDYWAIRKLEKERGIRLLISTSTLLDPSTASG